MQSVIQKNVMRRVYYSYGLSILSHQMFWQGMLFGGSVALFGRLTHVAALFDNILAVPLGNLPGYVSSAFAGAASNGELFTVVVTLAMVALMASFGYQLMRQLPSSRFRAA